MSDNSFRILRPDQTPGFVALNVADVVRDQSIIQQVIGLSLQAQGSNKSMITGFYSYLRGGRRKGGAGFQGVTKKPLIRLDVLATNIQTSLGKIGAKIDLTLLDPATIWDLEDNSIWTQLITTWPQNLAFFNQLRFEGVVGILGDIPSSAVKAIVLLPTDTVAMETTLIDLLS